MAFKVKTEVEFKFAIRIEAVDIRLYVLDIFSEVVDIVMSWIYIFSEVVDIVIEVMHTITFIGYSSRLCYV